MIYLQFAFVLFQPSKRLSASSEIVGIFFFIICLLSRRQNEVHLKIQDHYSVNQNDYYRGAKIIARQKALKCRRFKNAWNVHHNSQTQHSSHSAHAI